jgi:rhodanese-related sulfurtransferase
MINFGMVSWIILIVVLLIWGGFWLYNYLLRKNNATIISQEDFQQTMHSAQVVDIREANEYNSAHILGARNVPYSTLQQGVPGFNKTQPIYLYADVNNLTGRVAKKLREAGYENIYILDGGMRDWTGKVKRAN